MRKGIFVDDEDKVFALLMSTKGELQFEYRDVFPLPEQALYIREQAPIIVALDYRLDEDVKNVAAGHTYKGSGLAQLLRDEAIADPLKDFSLVLVSNEMKLKSLYAPDKTAHDLFDMVYSKEDVRTHRERVKRELLALAKAYEALRHMNVRYPLMDVLQADDRDEEWLISQELRLGFEQAKAPHLVVRVVLRNLIERPGLLIDDNGVCARFGIELSDFGVVRSWLSEAGLAYRGILADGWSRWWTHRVEGFAEDVFGAHFSELTSGDRAAKISEKMATSVKASKSPWNGRDTETPTFACSSCGRPTEMRHSLAAFDPSRPRYAMKRRICWDCIQTGKYSSGNSPLLVDETDEDLVENIIKADRD
jgi:hypothetical protein